MKSLRTSVLCAAITLCSISSFAQEQHPTLNEPNLNKPRLFSNLPDKIKLNITDFNALLGTALGSPTRLNLSTDNNLRFEGEVISSVSKYDNKLQTVVIRSSNFNGANLTLSRIVGSDGQVKYRGRIISFAHGDLFELENIDGQYQLVKKNFYDLVNE